MLAVAASVVSLIVVASGGPELTGERWMILVMVPLAALSVVGHFVSIWFSRRLG